MPSKELSRYITFRVARQKEQMEVGVLMHLTDRHREVRTSDFGTNPRNIMMHQGDLVAGDHEWIVTSNLSHNEDVVNVMQS